MDGFGTSTEEMLRAGAHAMTLKDSVLGELQGLKGRLVPLASGWSSDSYRVFVQLMERWDGNARTLGEALGSIGEAIRTSGTAYQAQEDQASSDLGAITAALG